MHLSTPSNQTTLSVSRDIQSVHTSQYMLLFHTLFSYIIFIHYFHTLFSYIIFHTLLIFSYIIFIHYFHTLFFIHYFHTFKETFLVMMCSINIPSWQKLPTYSQQHSLSVFVMRSFAPWPQVSGSSYVCETKRRKRRRN